MANTLSHTTVKNILTRTSGYLQTVCSHSLQPYRGCTFGSSLCGVGCYVQHNGHVMRGRTWGRFLEIRDNAAESYQTNEYRERRWAKSTLGRFSIFMSSSTDPFLPQERRFRITRGILRAMQEVPPDELIIQTHSDHVLDELDQLKVLSSNCQLRVHISIESDRESLPGLPPPACSVSARLRACAVLKDKGIRVVVAVAPLLPLSNPVRFFEEIARVADGVILDHFIGGDGSPTGSRTLRTGLPSAMEKVDRDSTSLHYLQEMLALAQELMPGRCGVGSDGFAGRFLNEPC